MSIKGIHAYKHMIPNTIDNHEGTMSKTAYTLGHSNRTINELLKILRKYNIDSIVDVRRWPKSRKHPWFNKEQLEKVLLENNIEYYWMGKELGGYRKLGRDVQKTSGATCFKSEGFRAYALYITNNDIAIKSLEKLEKLALNKKIVILCAEKHPWFCHRKIISDWLTARGFKIIHIIEIDKTIIHKLSKCAKVVNNKLYYI